MVNTVAYPQNSPNELVEELDLQGNVIGVISRAEMRARKARHRSVFIAVLSTKGEILVHQRAATKDIWPSWWDVAVGGVMQPGEHAVDAARRELDEELGIHGVELTELGTGVFVDSSVAVHASCFVCVHDGPFTFTDDEVVGIEWVSRDGLLPWLLSHQALPDSIALVLPLLSM